MGPGLRLRGGQAVLVAESLKSRHGPRAFLAFASWAVARGLRGLFLRIQSAFPCSSPSQHPPLPGHLSRRKDSGQATGWHSSDVWPLLTAPRRAAAVCPCKDARKRRRTREGVDGERAVPKSVFCWDFEGAARPASRAAARSPSGRPYMISFPF